MNNVSNFCYHNFSIFVSKSYTFDTNMEITYMNYLFHSKVFLIFIITLLAFVTATTINVVRWDNTLSANPKSHSLLLITGDEPATLLLTSSIVDHHTIFLEEFFKSQNPNNKLIFPPGWNTNPSLWESQLRSDGHYVSEKDAGLSFLLVPGFMLGGIFGAMITINVASSITSVVIYKFTSEITNEKTGFITSMIFSFGTLLFTYSNQIYSDVIITLFVILIIYFIFQKSKNSIYISCAGALLGFGVFLKIMFFLVDIVIIPMIIALLINRKIPKRNFVLFLAFFGFFTIFAILNNVYTYNSWIGSENTHSALDILVKGKPDPGGFDYNLASWRPSAIVESFFGKFHGLLIYSPILILFPLGTAKLWNHNKVLFITILLVAILIWLGYIWVNPNSIDIAGDPPFRYFLPIIPLLSLPFALGLYEFGHSVKYKIGALFTLIIGLSFSIVFGFDRLLSIDGSIWKSRVIDMIYVGTDAIFPNLGATYDAVGNELPHHSFNIYNIIFIIFIVTILLFCTLISFLNHRTITRSNTPKS